MEASLLYPAQCYLGESPVWHKTRNSCLWVDIEEGKLYEFGWHSRQVKVWDINRRVSFIIENNDGSLVLGVQGGIVRFNFEEENIEWLADIDKEQPDNRCNDGACDIAGRIWLGVMHIEGKENRGSLYCADLGLKVKKVIEGLTIPNGIVWSLDQERMYLVESPERIVKSYLFNKTTGDISFEKIAIAVPEELGTPDGLTIDEEGMLWVALYGGYAISRWDPRTGGLLQTIKLPVPNVTNCAFIGENLEHMIITTAREHLSEEELTKYPESGNIFVIKDVGVKGVESHKAPYGV